MIKLAEILLELAQSKHYKERKGQRGTILDVRLPDEAYGDYNKKEAKEKLIPTLQRELDSRYSTLEGADYQASMQKNVGVRFFNPIVVKDLKEYPVLMITGEGPKDKGYCFLAFVIDNELTTNYPSVATSAQDIAEKIKEHEKNELKNGREPAVFLPKTADVKIDLDELFGKEKEKASKVDIDTIDYVVRGDYRVGVPFQQEPFDSKYGPGKVKSADKGGKAGVDGRLDWVEIEHPKPVAVKKDSSGKATPVYTRKYGPVYTKTYFDIAKKKEPTTK